MEYIYKVEYQFLFRARKNMQVNNLKLIKNFKAPPIFMNYVIKYLTYKLTQ